MKRSVCTLVVAGTLAATNVDAAVNPDQIKNNVLHRIVSEAQQSLAMNEKSIVQDWQESWPKWGQCVNPNGC